MTAAVAAGALRPQLGDDPSWTRNPSRDKEWLIAHHKFVWGPDLVHAYRATGDDAYLRTWARLLDSWLREMGTGFIAQSDAQVEAKRVEHCRRRRTTP